MNRSELKQALLKGSLYLTLRQVLTLTLSLISVLLITRILGPEHYGWVIIAMSCNAFMVSFADMGLKVYLIRMPGDCSARLQGEILACLMMSGTMLAIIAALMAAPMAYWTNVPELKPILMAMAPAILLNTCAGVPLGVLERTLQYQRSSLAEMGSLLVYYLAAIPLVLMGWNVWGVVAAYLAQSLFQIVTVFIFHPIHPVLPQDLKILRTALSYGIGFSGAMWVTQGRGFVIPLLLGRFVGAEAVGLVGATTRIADLLCFAKTIAWQLGISGFAKLQEDLPAMRQALSRAITYQSFLLVPTLGIFTCLSPVLIPLVLGQKWYGVVGLFPFMALSFLGRGIFELHMLVLFAIGRNLDVLKFNLVNTVVMCGAIAVLGGPFDIWGYAAAEMICLTVYIMLHWSVSQIVGSPNYKPVLTIIACTLLPFLVGNRLSPFLSVPFFFGSFGVIYWISAEVRAVSHELATLLMHKFRPT